MRFIHSNSDKDHRNFYYNHRILNYINISFFDFLRIISSKEQSESNADINVFEGVTVHGAPEYVIANGKVVVYEYEMNPHVNQAKVLTAEPFPSILYDQVQDLDELSKIGMISYTI